MSSLGLPLLSRNHPTASGVLLLENRFPFTAPFPVSLVGPTSHVRDPEAGHLLVIASLPCNCDFPLIVGGYFHQIQNSGLTAVESFVPAPLSPWLLWRNNSVLRSAFFLQRRHRPFPWLLSGYSLVLPFVFFEIEPCCVMPRIALDLSSLGVTQHLKSVGFYYLPSLENAQSLLLKCLVSVTQTPDSLLLVTWFMRLHFL